MNELTTEEKARYYDMAIKKAKDAFNDGTISSNTIAYLQDLFPELKESEDERIRKKLIEAVKGDMVVGGTKDKQLAIAWLENQGEKKHQYKSRPRYVGEEELLGANKQGEQKSAENEELTEFDKAVGVSIGTWNPKSPEQIQSVKAVSKKLLKLAKKQINDEQKPAEWSEEDAKTLNRISAILVDASEVKNWWKEYRLIERDEMIRLTDFLKSLRPQPKQEWSIEDENIVKDIIARLRTHADVSQTEFDNYYHLLGSLKNRVQPQTTWKPSREQIMALRWVLNHIPYDSHKEEISGLLEQLKKLREE